ncbi:hypothetical protein QBC46DRAFT_404255 [Diplogelasinospora grovesii]|uniref:Uncharacterized protein n=1 Tax=Diplogelasinospora grovesii TaxID=303347 RepID=A0AAN6NF94_9PEZI|nr:hypothetical protein QBC46DRAFT_404255 [Diplogelasinospora grovesii]
MHSAPRLSESSTPDPGLTATTANGGPPQTITVPGSSVSVSVPEDSQVKLECNPQLNAPLENLPPEIRLQLLFTLGLAELRALVSASPVFHQQYVLDRMSVLRRCLETTLRSVTADAFAVYQSGSPDFPKTHTNDMVAEFLESHQRRRSSTQYSGFTEALTENEVVGMAAFHSSIIEPFMQHYSSWALANLENSAKDSQNHGPLSETEEIRLMRAFYLFQLCCNIFGPDRREEYWVSAMSPEHDIFYKLFDMVGPRQTEAAHCIFTFAKEKYREILRDIYWDVHRKNPKFGGRRSEGLPVDPDGAFDALDNGWETDEIIEATAARGLKLLHTVVFKIKDHTHLVSTMQQHVAPCGSLEYDLTRRYYRSDLIRRWGFVMWDAPRLARTGLKEILAQAVDWEGEWDDERGDNPLKDDYSSAEIEMFTTL